MVRLSKNSSHIRKKENHKQASLMDGICVGLISTIILIINTLSFVVSEPAGFISKDCEATKDRFISIDCGATEDHCDDNRTKIHWTSDNKYLSIGERSTIPGEQILFPDHELLTARSFPTGMKNCYDINTTDSTKYLLRVRVLYTKYYVTRQDHTMYLIVDDTIIKMITPSTGTGTYEFIITAVSNVTSVCFGRVNGDPFVNSIELRELSQTMYPSADRRTILSIMHLRVAESEYDIYTSRYPNDTYDRFWVPSVFPNLEHLNTSENKKCAENTVDKVPSHLMEKGVKSDCSIEGRGRIDGYEIALTFFSAEFANQRKLQVRTKLEYIALNGNSVTFNQWSDFASGGCNFTIKSNNDFALINTTYNFTIQLRTTPSVCPMRAAVAHPNPPVTLNAFHVSSPRYRPEKGTNKTEFGIMRSIRDHFKITKWTGDPCLSVNFTWDKVECDYDGPNATVKSVDLSNMNLKTNVTDLFTGLKSLRTLDLSNNDLYGELPDTLFENHLLKVDYSNNPELRRKGLTRTQKNILIGIVVPVGIIALFVGFLAFRHFRGKTPKEYTEDTTGTQGAESTETSKWQVPWSSPTIEKGPTQT